MKQAIIGCAAAIVLAGCSIGPTTISPEQRLATMCKSYDSTLEVLTAVKPKLTAEQIETVNDVRAIANPICYQHDITSTESALEKLERVLAQLNGIQAKVGDYGP